ncbi:MAG: EAL domain-containing protein, partial [Gallionella sp.]|nr:EAL domain-containing protein [Gallionella sp.]
IARDGQCRALEFDFTLKNGEKRTGSFSAVVSRLEGIPHLVSTVHDITERKQMENALKGSETRFRAIIEATPVPLALNDAAGNITYLNRAFHDTLGYTLADIPTLDAWWPLAYPDPQYRQHILQNWGHATEQAMVSNSDITSIEGEVRCKNGQTRTFIIGGSPLAGEQAYLYLVSLYDITERKQAALKLQRNESLLRTTLDSTDEGILMIGGNGSLLASNQRFMELWKIPQQISESGKDELLLNHVLDQLIDPQVFLDQVHRLYGSDDEARDTLYFKDGRVFSRFTRALIIDGQRGRIWCFKDITEQHQKDNELQASKSLLRTVIDTVPVRVFWKDHASRFLGCNLAFARDAGLSHPAELIGKDDTQMTWKDQAELYRADDRQVMTSGQAKLTFDEPQTTPDGHEIWLRTSKTPLYNQANEVVGIVGVYDDITEQKHNEQALQASEFKLRTVLNNVDAYIYLKDTDGHYLFANRPVRELWQTEMEDIVGFGDEKFFDAATTSNIRINDQRVLQDGETLRAEETNTVPETGNTATFLSTKLPLRNEAGKIYALCGISTDITARKQIELELAEREAQLRMLVQAVPDSVQFKDGAGRWLIANTVCLRLFGLEGLAWQNLTDTEIGQRHPHLATAMAACRAGDEDAWQTGKLFRIEETVPDADGTSHHYDVLKAPLFDEQGGRKALVIVARDITEKKQSEELIWNQANFDSLTQLPNRRMFRDRLRQDIKKAHRAGLKLALLFLDLDHFKEVNDTLGHDAGDALLIDAAYRISACVRESDTVARLGGDEFTIILAELEDNGAVERIAANIIQSLSQPFYLETDTLYISASIGITLYPNDGIDSATLLKNADQAMFAAKQSGRNRYSYFTSDLQQEAQYRQQVINDLRIALAEEQFQLYYQPIVELATGRVHKAECLLRWLHPERGLINPDEFIPLTEDSGIIHELGVWVFSEAAKQLNHCREYCGKGFQLSVNVSPVQFQDAIKQQKWLDILKANNLQGDSIVIEITEGLLLETADSVTEQLLAFRDAGIQVAIDDFGTGYSALSYLNKLDIDYLKIDQSFIRNLVADSSDMALVEAIIVMAHKLGLQVIAEGVETAEQNALLQTINCDYVQGYYYSHALPADQLEAWLQARRASVS